MSKGEDSVIGQAEIEAILLCAETAFNKQLSAIVTDYLENDRNLREVIDAIENLITKVNKLSHAIPDA